MKRALIVSVVCLALLAAARFHESARARPEQAVPNQSTQVAPAKSDVVNEAVQFLLLTRKGPLLVEATINVNGEPFRAGWETLVDQLFKDADVDEDGKATWTEAMNNPRFGFGLLGYQRRSAAQTKQMVAQYDKNKDGIVNRDEARQLLSMHTGGGPFSVIGQQNYNSYRYNISRSVGTTEKKRADPAVRKLLDTDGDRSLSKSELAAAARRLRSRDADDDGLLSLTESGSAPMMFPYLVFS